MPTQLQPGDYVGGEYRILKVFGGEGESGMGVVYLVENRSFYEPFVLKTYQSGKVGDRRPRFLKEAQAWVQLGSHPHVVRCLWVNEIDGDLYIAAQYIEPDEDGINTLAQRIKAGLVPIDRQLHWSVEFCYGMRHANRKGLISHRDLKPANLMLDRGSLKVTDFGLSKFAGHVDQTKVLGGPVAPGMTMEGVAFGTPPFMAPEQFLNFAGVDHRADIYSFGVILYLMATGELPLYPDRQPKSENEVTLLWAIAHHRGIVRRAGFPLFPVVERCLEKSPAKRFQSFDEVLSALEMIAKAHKLRLPKEELQDSEFDDAFALAMSLVSLRKLEEAVKKLHEITRRWPGMPGPFTEMGKILLERGETDSSIPWFKRAVEIDESRSAPWNNLGAAHARLGQLDAAEHAYTAAIHVDSENTGAMLGLAQLLMEKNPTLAWKWCERAFELRPAKLSVLLIGGEAALRVGEPVRAAELLSSALEQAPDDQRTSFNLSLAYRAGKMLKQHVDALGRHLKHWPHDGAAYQLLCQGYVDIGQIETAVDVCLRWKEVPGAEVAGSINLANLLAAQGKSLNGYVFLNKTLERFPRHAGLWLCMAHILQEVPQYRKQALTAAENAMICLNEPLQQPPRVKATDIEPLLRKLM